MVPIHVKPYVLNGRLVSFLLFIGHYNPPIANKVRPDLPHSEVEPFAAASNSLARNDARVELHHNPSLR